VGPVSSPDDSTYSLPQPLLMLYLRAGGGGPGLGGLELAVF
jgi:hypothetical protein